MSTLITNTDAVLTFTGQWSRHDMADYIAPAMSCAEVDALAGLLYAIGEPAAADMWVAAHARKAEPGDKTMVDALEPFVRAFTAAVADGAPTPPAWRAASDCATAAAAATAEMAPKVGRARTHGTKSLGTPDPGAVSFALVAQATATTLTKER